MQVDPSSAPRVVELDALRGLAALAVVGFHYTTLYDQLYGFALFVSGRLRALRFRPFVFLGAISYSLYLLHQAIGFSLMWRFEQMGIGSGASALLAVVLVTALAVVLTFTVERPALRWIRDAWKRRRERRQPALAAIAAGIIPLFAPEASAAERRGTSAPVAQTASARLGSTAMDEPHRAAFAALIRGGASSQDIHHASADVAYAAAIANVDEAYLAREIERVDAHRRNLLPLLEAFLGNTPAILDVGCNTGGTTLALALSERLDAREVVGVDPNRTALEAARVRQHGHAVDAARLRFEAIDAGQPLPFDDGHFDLVTVVSVLEFVGSPQARRAFAREIERVTRPGGHVFVATPNPWRLRELHSRRWFGDLRHSEGFPWASSPLAIRRMFTACDELPIGRAVASSVFSTRHLPGPGLAYPLVIAALPWQKHLFRKR